MAAKSRRTRCRAACRVTDDDCDCIGNFMSFQFDADAGFLMDFSILETGWDFPLKWGLGDLPWEDGRIERILSAFGRIRPGMKDGMLIDFDNDSRWSAFAVDLFPRDPTPEGLAWMASIKPELEAMWEAVTVEEEHTDGRGGRYAERLFIPDYHFVIFPGKEEQPGTAQ